MNYLVAFDIRDVDFMAPIYWSTGLIAVLTATVFVVSRKSLDGRGGRIFSWFVLCVAVSWTAYAWVSTSNLYKSAIAAFSDGHASIVEGRVSSFEPMPPSGHGAERFCVQSQCFFYSGNDDSIGFSKPSTRGGPIKADLPVRVTFVGNTIVRLEIASGT
jgi:hypothetical protein